MLIVNIEKINSLSILDMNKKYRYNNATLLVDSSYVTFHRFFASQMWYTKNHEDDFDEDYDWSTNEEFMKYFDDNYMNSIEKIRAKYDIPYTNVIFVRDCPRESIWRIKEFPEYKRNRKNTCKFQNRKYNIGNIFRHVYSNLYPKLCDKYGIKVVKVATAEADDVIAVLSKKIHEEDPRRLIVIITNDNDFLQLINSKGKVYIWSLQNNLLNTKVGDNPYVQLVYKILTGDSSDNIPPCFDRCDPDLLYRMCTDPDVLKHYMERYPVFYEKFRRNRRLIDFDCIPDDIQETILEECDEFLNSHKKIKYYVQNHVPQQKKSFYDRKPYYEKRPYNKRNMICRINQP